MRWIFYRFLYRPLMKLAHRYHWHHAPPLYPDGDTQLWCRWCGLRQVIARRPITPLSVEAQQARKPVSPADQAAILALKEVREFSATRASKVKE